MKIFIIGGKARSGKNTLGEYLKEELKNYGLKPCIMHITEPLYNYARNYFEWDGNTEDKPREFLQKMGIEIINIQMNKKNFLLNRLYEDIDILKNFFDTFIIVDARLINEFESIKNKFSNVTTIKLERNKKDNNLTNEEKNHITETEIDKYTNFDYIIENKDLNSLKTNAIKIVKEEIRGKNYE